MLLNRIVITTSDDPSLNFFQPIEIDQKFEKVVDSGNLPFKFHTQALDEFNILSPYIQWTQLPVEILEIIMEENSRLSILPIKVMRIINWGDREIIDGVLHII